MIPGYNSITQAFLGTLFTWGLTAVGSGFVFIFRSGRRKILDGSLGFAAGVMIAASYWSLLDPAIEMAQTSGSYGDTGQWAFVPVAIGFTLGSLFVYAADICIPYMGDSPTSIALAINTEPKRLKDGADSADKEIPEEDIPLKDASSITMEDTQQYIMQRRRPAVNGESSTLINPSSSESSQNLDLSISDRSAAASWKRILLLIVAVTIHNIPEGLAVGVGFGAIGKSKSATFESARNLAIGIGIQNFPEGLAVSLPLRGAGFSILKCFWYGQLSGMVEPIAGIFGALAVSFAEPLLPYALAFAAGAMIYVVLDDIIPEAQSCGNGKLASWSSIFGFVVMMSLDVGLA